MRLFNQDLTGNRPVEIFFDSLIDAIQDVITQSVTKIEIFTSHSYCHRWIMRFALNSVRVRATNRCITFEH